MIMLLHGDREKAKVAVRWLNDNVAPNNRADLLPGYASFLNGTVRWDAIDGSWYVSEKPRKGTIEVKMPGDPYLKTQLMLMLS